MTKKLLQNLHNILFLEHSPVNASVMTFFCYMILFLKISCFTGHQGMLQNILCSSPQLSPAHKHWQINFTRVGRRWHPLPIQSFFCKPFFVAESFTSIYLANFWKRYRFICLLHGPFYLTDLQRMVTLNDGDTKILIWLR